MFQKLQKLNISYIFNLHIVSRQKTTTFIWNFGNYSKGIFGNHVTANGCQNMIFCEILETWKS